jgi:hypothetical protein
LEWFICWLANLFFPKPNSIYTMKKINSIFIALLLLFTFSCGNDDEPALETQRLSLEGRAQLAPIPESMITNENPKAFEAYAYASTINALGSFFIYFAEPHGAARTSNPIVVSGQGSISTGSKCAVWRYEEAEFGLAYQICDGGDRWTWQYFLKYDGGDWRLWFEAYEMKDRSRGEMNFYTDEGTFHPIFKFSWQRSGDIFDYSYKTYNGTTLEEEVKLRVNIKTGAGNLTFFEGVVKTSYMEWDAQGNGSWEEYDGGGNVTGSGSWTSVE